MFLTPPGPKRSEKQSPSVSSETLPLALNRGDESLRSPRTAGTIRIANQQASASLERDRERRPESEKAVGLKDGRTIKGWVPSGGILYSHFAAGTSRFHFEMLLLKCETVWEVIWLLSCTCVVHYEHEKKTSGMSLRWAHAWGLCVLTLKAPSFMNRFSQLFEKWGSFSLFVAIGCYNFETNRKMVANGCKCLMEWRKSLPAFQLHSNVAETCCREISWLMDLCWLI